MASNYSYIKIDIITKQATSTYTSLSNTPKNNPDHYLLDYLKKLKTIYYVTCHIISKYQFVINNYVLFFSE